jgi:ketosteroid isomerase-like protein
MKLTTGLTLVLATVLATGPSRALAQREGHGAMGDSAAVASVVAKYHEALAAGDSAAALALLSDDAVILETGGVETRAEYRSQHLPADINFAKATRSQYGPVLVRVHGDVAWATSTGTTQGEMNGRAINSAGAELMVLTRSPQGWKIAAIHWSSRQRRAG